MESMNELFRLSLELGKSKEWTLSELKPEGGDKGQFYKARKQDQKKEQCRITKHDKERIARLSKTVAMARRLRYSFPSNWRRGEWNHTEHSLTKWNRTLRIREGLGRLFRAILLFLRHKVRPTR